MNSKALWRTVRVVAVIMLTVGTSALAQAPTPVHFSGVINDYSPSNIKPTGPWEIRGPWTLNLNGESGTADFSAALTMELSDYAISEGIANVDTPGTRSPHTHHIVIEGGTVTPITGGFEVSGPVTITKDGTPAPLSPSMLVVDITGGTSVPFSNITLTFQGGATGHFGKQAIHGVVRKAK